MRATRVLLTAALALLLVGCVDKTKVVRSTPPQTGQTTGSAASPGSAPLTANLAGYVALPENGRYGNRHYETSGQMTANALAAAFGRHLTPIETGRRVETLEESLATAKDSGATYLIFPQILHWEDRATEWSGKRDRLEVKVSIFDTETGAVLDSAVLSGVSKWGTFGGDHPQDMLPKPAQAYAASLFE